MSSDWWLNQLGTAAVATTPTGAIPQYSLAADIGTAPWPDQSAFNAWAVREVERTRKPDIERIQAAKQQSEDGWFQKALGAVGFAATSIVGAWNEPGELYKAATSGPVGIRPEEVEGLAKSGAQTFHEIGQMPGIKQAARVWDDAWQGFSTPFYASTLGYRNDDPWWFLDGSKWSQAWQLAEERTPGQAIVDWVLTGQDPKRSQADLDRLKRTNSLYGIAAFATDLGVMWKLDPTVLGAKGVGELRRIHAGELPAMSSRPDGLNPFRSKAGTIPTEALRAVRGEEPLSGGLASRYGQWRGNRIRRTFDGDLRVAAREMSPYDFYSMPMFRQRNATNGAAAAEMLRIAAKDDALWDLTRRAAFADPAAWAEIKAMQTGQKPLIPGADTRTYLDAIEAQKGKFAKLEQELNDLEDYIAKRDVQGPGRNAGYFEYYSKELHSSYEQKLLDLEDLSTKLNQYEDYASWLDMVPTFDNSSTMLSSAKVALTPFDHLRQRTYQKNIWGPVHQISEIGKAGYLKEANAIDLHRVDSGVESIRRQFDQFKHLFGYENPEALSDILVRFTRTHQRGDHRGAALIAKEVEEQHLVRAIADKHSLAPETVTAFLNQTRFRMNEMTNALLSGDRSIYTTAPGTESARLVRRQNGSAIIELTDGQKRTTIKVPEEALDGIKDTATLAVDPTQTPNWYTPLNTREVALAVKRNPELFEELDSAMRNRGRAAAGAAMEAVDKFGTAFNRLWKPMQLFRLAWPQRVLMDETLRGMALLGVSSWMANYPQAFFRGANNIVVGGFENIAKRRSMKIGPGPVADRTSGRVMDTAAADDLAEQTPFVPSYFEPKVNPKRAEGVRSVIQQSDIEKRAIQRRWALMRNPNSLRSLPDGTPTPADWVDIEMLFDVTPKRTFPNNYKGPDQHIMDPLPGSDYSLVDVMSGITERQLRGWQSLKKVAEDFLDSRPELADDLAKLQDWEKALFSSADELRTSVKDLAAEQILEALQMIQKMDARALATVLSESGPRPGMGRAMTMFRQGGELRPLIDELAKAGSARRAAQTQQFSSGKNFLPLFDFPMRDATRLEAIDYHNLAVARERGAKYAPLDYWSAEKVKMVIDGKQRLLSQQIPEVKYSAPIFQKFEDTLQEALTTFFQAENGVIAPKGHKVQGVFDPVTAKQAKSGYAVPVTTERFPMDGAIGGDWRNNLQQFLAKNEELLAAGNYRVQFKYVAPGQLDEAVMVDPMKMSLEVSVVRLFNTKEVERAAEFAHHVNADRFWNIAKDHDEYVLQHGESNRFMEALHRKFTFAEGEPEFTPGEMPVTGDPTGARKVEVYHASETEVPEDLLPRDDPHVPVANGRMIGNGFYTSTDLDEVAAAYGRGWDRDSMPETIYTIRGSKSGKTYRVFDLDKDITDADRAKLHEFVDEWADGVRQHLRDNPDGGVDGAEYWLNEFEGELSRFKQRIDNTYTNSWDNYDNTKWVNLMASSEEFYSVSTRIPQGRGYPRRLITDFLEKEYNAGALTHVGGTRGTVGGGGHHQVYVWLHPEDLMVRPAWEGTGKFELLEDYFTNPKSQEVLYDEFVRDEQGWGMVRQVPRNLDQVQNPVPENRVHRVGDKPRTQSLRANGQLRSQERAVLDMDELNVEFDMHIDSLQERFLRRIWKKRELGKGTTRFRNADGDYIEAPAALEGMGEIYVPLMSGAPAYARLTDTYKRSLNMSRSKAVGYKRLMPPEVTPEVLKTRAGFEAAKEYYTTWADLLNDQVRNSPIWRRMLAGESDDQIVSWLEHTAAGAKLRKELPHKGYDPERWVAEHRQALDFYLPRKDLQSLLHSRRIDPSELRRIEREQMPEVYGPDLELIDGGTKLGRWWHNAVERIYTELGTRPTDALSRQPFFKGMYDLRMKNLVAATEPEALTEELIQAYAKQSREFALRQVKRTMYELGDDTNMTQALRFLAPFWGAQQEAMLKWASIVLERPETVARFYLGMNEVYDRLTVIDEDGKPVKRPSDGWGAFGYNPNDRIVFQVPKQLRNIEPFKTMLAGQSTIRTALGSANTALQGDKPHLPSLGPLIAMPADQFINAMWDTHGTQFDDNFFYRWLFPVGRPPKGIEGALEYMMPGWGRRMEQLRKGMDSRTYANTWYSVYREMERDHNKRGLPAPTPEEVDKAVKWHFGLRMIASFAGPVSVEFAPKNQFYLDQYHAMQQKYGPNRAFEKFVEKFGAEAARYAASSSQAIGVPPTAEGMREWTGNKQLIQKLHEAGMDDLISAVISPDAWADDFSSDAYAAQFDVKLGPGTNKTLREVETPGQRVREIDARLGWLDYRQFMSAVNAELYARGLRDLDQTGAEDLKAIKEDFLYNPTTGLATKYPSWYDQYRTFSDTIYQRVAALRSFVGEKQFDNRPDIQGVRQYLMIRDQVAAELDNYHMETGGSRSLQAIENTDLRNWFFDQVGQLIQDNPMFGEFYLRYLDSDRLERGSGP